jgi:hypothetical protein
MKKLFLISMLVAGVVTSQGLQAQARSLTPHLPMVAVDNVSAQISKVVVDNYGVMNVYPADPSAQVVTTQLSNENFQYVTDQARGLSKAAVHVFRKHVVCMMVVSPYQPMLQVSNTTDMFDFTGEMRDILSMQSCAIPTTVTPVEENDIRNARELKAVIIALANEAVQ